MGNPTGATVEAPVAPAMPYGEQMANVARDTGAVAHTLADEMTVAKLIEYLHLFSPCLDKSLIFRPP